jgi:glycerol-1-phosphate dehydrogenase [NAD(P)+]
MTLDATKAVTESAEAIKAGDVAAYEKLIYGLLMSGLAMQMLGNSRCASGAEHHISHLIEMQPEHLGVKSDALHGEKVGVGTLLACREYHRLKDSRVKWGNYRQASPEYIKEMFGNTLGLSITEENTKDCARGITAQLIEEKWEQIWDIIGTVPTYKELMERYEILGVKSSLVDIDVPPEKTNLLLEYSPLVRNRLTLMRLRRAIIGEESK